MSSPISLKISQEEEKNFKNSFPIKTAKEFSQFIYDANQIIRNSWGQYFIYDKSKLKSDYSLKNVVILKEGKFKEINKDEFFKINPETILKITILWEKHFSDENYLGSKECKFIRKGRTEIVGACIEEMIKKEEIKGALKILKEFFKKEKEISLDLFCSKKFNTENKEISFNTWKQMSDLKDLVENVIKKFEGEEDEDEYEMEEQSNLSIVSPHRSEILKVLYSLEKEFLEEYLNILESNKDSIPWIEKIFEKVKRNVYEEIGSFLLKKYIQNGEEQRVADLLEKIFYKENFLQVDTKIVEMIAEIYEEMLPEQTVDADLKKMWDIFKKIEEKRKQKSYPKYGKVTRNRCWRRIKMYKESVVSTLIERKMEKLVVEFLSEVKFLNTWLKFVDDCLGEGMDVIKDDSKLKELIKVDETSSVKSLEKNFLKMSNEFENFGEKERALVFDCILEKLEEIKEFKNEKYKNSLISLYKKLLNNVGSSLNNVESRLNSLAKKFKINFEKTRKLRRKKHVSPNLQKKPKTDNPIPNPSTSLKTNKIASTILLVVASAFSILTPVSGGIAATVIYLAPYLGIFTALATLPLALQIFIIATATLIPTIVAGALWIAFGVVKSKANAEKTS